MISSVTINVEVDQENSIQRIAEDIHDLAGQVDCNLKFVYKEIEMIVTPYHVPEAIVKEWERRKKGLPEEISLKGSIKNIR